IRRIEVAFVTVDVPRVKSGVGVTEVGRYSARLLDGAPADGKPMPLRIRLPASAPVSFTSSTLAIAWRIEVRAVIAFGSDVTLSIPIAVTARHVQGDETPPPVPRVAPVGKERRALVWADVARRMHLENDADAEQMT